MKLSKVDKRQRIHKRIRKKVKGTSARPRLCVFRSNKLIYCQLIDDVSGVTLANASSIGNAEGSKAEQAKKVGLAIAEKAKAKNIDRAVFDRCGYLYHGRVKALADGAREAGLNI